MQAAHSTLVRLGSAACLAALLMAGCGRKPAEPPLKPEPVL
jgi:hypothetical protein